MALGCDQKSFCVQLKKFIKQEFNSLHQGSRCLVTLKSMTYVNADYQIKFVSQLSQPDFVWTQSLTCLKLILLWHSRSMNLESFKICSWELLALRIGMDHSKTSTQKLKRLRRFWHPLRSLETCCLLIRRYKHAVMRRELEFLFCLTIPLIIGIFLRRDYV